MFIIKDNTYLVTVAGPKGKKFIVVIPTIYDGGKNVTKEDAKQLAVNQLAESKPGQYRVHSIVKTSNEVVGQFITLVVKK